jgi:hypothetical protein
MPATASGPVHRRRLAWWLIVFAGYATVVAVVTQGPSRAWGVWAAAGYALAALAARRSRGSALPLLIGAYGAMAAPAIWLAARWQPGSEPAVVARAAFLLVHHGSPYLPASQLLSAQSYNPYLPAMSVFGFPSLAGLPGAGGSPASWMAVTSLALVAAAIGVGLPQPGSRALLRYTALAVATPVLAFPIALGETDPPVIALMCLALACASRSAAAAPARTGPWPRGAASRWITWNGLAAVAIGMACAMKAIAWLALPVLAAMILTREGPRAAARFVGVAAVTAMILTAVFAPALLAQPGAFADNIIAYPLGLTPHLTPAASPLPGHLLASTGPGRLAALGLLLAAAAGVAASLVLRPPRNAQAAAARLALALAILFALAPNARFGYFAYPAALLGWAALTPAAPVPRAAGRVTTGPFGIMDGGQPAAARGVTSAAGRSGRGRRSTGGCRGSRWRRAPFRR